MVIMILNYSNKSSLMKVELLRFVITFIQSVAESYEVTPLFSKKSKYLRACDI